MKIAAMLFVAFLLFGAIVYAISKGYEVKTGMKWLGASMTFETQKNK